jgi:tetratricopeptide (TPR) repeat protein
MAERIEKIIQTNPNRSHFFALGAGHFWGKTAIQNYLAKKGFKITRMGTMYAQPVAEVKMAGVTEENQSETQKWYEKGILYTVYGNDQAAIPYFQKVIDSNPSHSDAYFQLGVSYGETGAYQKAISAIDKAIELNSEKDDYYYGRGRIYGQQGCQKLPGKVCYCRISLEIVRRNGRCGCSSGQLENEFRTCLRSYTTLNY